MPKRTQIELSREELERAEIPTNHVLVRLVTRSEGIKTKAGVVVGFLTDDTFASDETDKTAHPADVAEVYGVVEKAPKQLYFNPEDTAKSMDWKTDMELMVGDMVWFSVLESKNAHEILCDGVVYRSIPYADCYVAKREVWLSKFNNKKKTEVVCLNGYVLCTPLKEEKQSELDHLSKDKIDMTKAKIAFIGNPPKRYIREHYTHIDDLRVGDTVLFERRTPLFLLERTRGIATFDNDNQYWVVARRRIVMVLNRENNGTPMV